MLSYYHESSRLRLQRCRAGGGDGDSSSTSSTTSGAYDHPPLIQEDLLASARTKMDQLFDRLRFLTRSGPLTTYLNTGTIPDSSSGGGSSSSSSSSRMFGAYLSYYNIPHPTKLRRLLPPGALCNVAHLPLLRQALPDVPLASLLKIIEACQ